MGFSRQKYWTGLPLPFTGDLPHQGLNLCLLHCRWILYQLSYQGSPCCCCCSDPRFSSVQSLSHVRLFATPWTAAHQASLSITNSQSLLKLMSIESVMPSSYFILCRPLLFSVFLKIRVFPMSQFFATGGQSIRASASSFQRLFRTDFL